MDDFGRELKEKAERMGYEMKGLAHDMGNEMRGMRDVFKEKAGKIGDEIRKKLIR